MGRIIKDTITGQFIKHTKPNACTICGKVPIRGNGLCNMHWYRQYRYGDPYFRKKRANGEGPIRSKEIKINGKTVLEHRYLMEQHIGRALHRTEVVHHIDGNPLNNSIDNLCLMSMSEHISHHRTKRPKNGREHNISKYPK